MKLDFYKGADISGLPELEDRRVMIRTAEGQEMDAFELCRQNGVNSIRLRIWNEPEIVPEAKGYCSLEHTIAMAKRIKEKGMHFLLDFHYSDWWADPGNQTKPHAWTNLHGEDLEKAVCRTWCRWAMKSEAECYSQMAKCRIILNLRD